MKILIINAGSSSLKYQLIRMQENQADSGTIPSQLHTVMAAGVVERIGDVEGKLTHKKFTTESSPAGTRIDNGNPVQVEKKFITEQEIKDHGVAMHLAAQSIIDPDSGVIAGKDEIDAIGHRVVQGGEDFNASILIDENVKNAIKANSPLAPLHNPPNLMGIEVAEELFPGISNVAVFDTEFHQTIPPKAYMYALPYEFYQKHKVRRYGFHGTSHKYVAVSAAELMGKKRENLNLITVHLGNGCSICAVEKGKCVDTSMGMTPLAGVMMGTRTGDMDPAIQNYLLKNTDLTPEELDDTFNKKSGLKGICGMNDLRDIHDQIQKGDELAKLALEMFTYQVKKYVGAYAAVLGHVDGIIFTAGIGENDDIVREKVCSNLSGLGVELDAQSNAGRISEPKPVHSQNSLVELWVVPTNEELQIAREVVEVLK